jgi:hypothetical protein
VTSCVVEAVDVTARVDKAASEAKAKAKKVFLDLMALFAREGRDVSPNRSPSYAPNVFARRPDADGVSNKQVEAAMDALLNLIHIEKMGQPPSRGKIRLVEGASHTVFEHPSNAYERPTHTVYG